MNPDYYGLIEMVLSFGVILGFGVWQLVSLRRAKQRDAAAKPTIKTPPDSK